MNYYDLSLHERINYKGFVSSKARYFGTAPPDWRMILWLTLADHLMYGPKTRQQLLFFRNTPRGIKYY